MSERVLVTGGAGFIGSHVSRRLLDQGRRVVVLDNFDPYYEASIKRGNVADVSARPEYRLVEGDIRDASTLDTLFAEERFDGVIHLAARAGVRPSIEDPATYTSVNLVGTTALLEACRAHGVRRFAFGSSSSVYGNNEKVPFSEDDLVDHPISPYAATKKAGEALCHAHHHLFGIAVACLRFFTVYGPSQRPDLAIHKFTRKIDRGETIEQFGDGSSSRDYTYVDDIVRGVIAAFDRMTGFHVWNLGGSNTVRLSELIRLISGALGKEPNIRVLPQQPGDVDRTWADVAKAKADLDWEPTVAIEDGIERFIRWYREPRVASAGDGAAEA